MNLLKKSKKLVDKKVGFINPHYVRALYWVKQFGEEDDLALQIAAYAHDIERVSKPKGTSIKAVKKSNKGFLDKTKLSEHQIEGAKIMKTFLLENGASQKLAEDVYHLISMHEVGGDKRQNILKDADSVSFFECNGEKFVNKFAKEVGYEKVHNKLVWMFERITSNEAREIAKPLYAGYITELEKNYNGKV